MNLDDQDWTEVKLDHERVLKEMTLPDERYRAVVQTEKFLREILATPRVPKTIKDRARSMLRHYPSEYDMSKTAQTSPDIFAERMEDVSRLMKVYEESQKAQG
jgi:hypothetical protein